MHFYWPGMRAYTTAYVESCVHCRAPKSLNQNSGGLLQPLLIPFRCWSHVSLDFVTDSPLTARGNDAILVLVDTLSKVAHFITTTKTVTAEAIVELLADRLIRYHGSPQVLIYDRNPRFQLDLWRQLCHRFNIKRAMSSARHPQSDGRTEHTIRTLEQMLRTYIQTGHYNAHTSDGARHEGPTFRLPPEEQNKRVPFEKLTLWGIVGIPALQTCQYVDTEQRVKLPRLFRPSKDTGM